MSADELYDLRAVRGIDANGASLSIAQLEAAAIPDDGEPAEDDGEAGADWSTTGRTNLQLPLMPPARPLAGWSGLDQPAGFIVGGAHGIGNRHVGPSGGTWPDHVAFASLQMRRGCGSMGSTKGVHHVQ